MDKEDTKASSFRSSSEHKDLSTEVKDGPRREEKEKEARKRLLNLLIDQTALVTDTKIAADAKVILQRSKLDKTHTSRAQRLEEDAKLSQANFDEITRGWSIVNEKVLLPDLQQASKKQQDLCSKAIQDKKKLINELQQALKKVDDEYVCYLKANEEEIDLMIERMDSQNNILIKAYREELNQIERIHKCETNILITNDMADWDQAIKQLCDKELEMLVNKKKKLEEYEEELQKLNLELAHQEKGFKMREIAEMQREEMDYLQRKIDYRNSDLKKQKWTNDDVFHKNLQISSKKGVLRLEKKIKRLQKLLTSTQEEYMKQRTVLSKGYKQTVDQYESLKTKAKQFALVDARMCEGIRQMIEAELKELAEKALKIDLAICQQVFGLPSKWAELPLSGPSELSQPHKMSPKVVLPTPQMSKDGHVTEEAPAGQSFEMDAEDPNTEEEGKWSEVLKLLSNQTDFLIEAGMLKVFPSLETEEKADNKTGSVFNSLGIQNIEKTELTEFLLKYEQQHKEQSEEACAAGIVTSAASELIHPNHFLPALKSFLKEKRQGESSTHKPTMGVRVNTRDALEYWEKLANVIPKEELKLWDAVEKILKQDHHVVLTEISDLTPETERLKQRNEELRLQLQERLTTKSMTASVKVQS